MNERLLPCPFCGSDELLEGVGYIKCVRCGVEVANPRTSSHDQLSAAWNRRAGEMLQVQSCDSSLAVDATLDIFGKSFETMEPPSTGVPIEEQIQLVEYLNHRWPVDRRTGDAALETLRWVQGRKAEK